MIVNGYGTTPRKYTPRFDFHYKNFRQYTGCCRAVIIDLYIAAAFQYSNNILQVLPIGELVMKTVILSMFFCVLCSIGFVSFAQAASSDGVISRMTTVGKISDAQAREQFDLVFNSVKEELKAGGQVSVKNFGKFYVQSRGERVGRNPKNGAQLQIPAKRYARFTTTDNFKNELNPGIGKATPIAETPIAEAETSESADVAKK